jgi:uncharacterized tellurite resistance protein B-like protein
MYQNHIVTPDQALVHLAFHCSLKDGELQKEELEFISSSFVAKGINKELDIKEEIKFYKDYCKTIKDETAYLIFLIRTIKPTYKMALFAFCAEIVYRNGRVSLGEEVLLNKIADLLFVKDEENMAIQKLITEMNQVENRNFF